MGSRTVPVTDTGRQLLTPFQGPAQEPRPDPHQWCRSQISRLCQLEAGEISRNDVQDDISILHQELQSLFVISLQHDREEVWEYFIAVLHNLEPIRDFLDGLPQLQHYLERFLSHIDKQIDRLTTKLPLRAALVNLFPQQISTIELLSSQPKHVYCTPSPPPPCLTPRTVVAPSKRRHLQPNKYASQRLPDGTNPFLLDRPGEEDKFKPTDSQLTFGDLRKSIGNVAAETANRESVWNSSAGFLVAALQTDLPDDPRALPRSRTKLEPVREETAAKRVFNDTMKNYKPINMELPRETMTAREAVAYFARLYHLGKIHHMYFNIKESIRYQPYDLIAVPKQKVNPDYYIFSSFGVLSVSCNSPNEVVSLGEWFRQAVIHAAISKIPFFKNYLLRRAFNGWTQLRRQAEYRKRQRYIASTLLHCVTNYGTAVLSVSKLLQELSTVKFLPLERDVCYSMDWWLNKVNYKQIQSEKFLERFYMHVRHLIEHAKKEQYEKLMFMEKQVANKAVFTKESLFLANKKTRMREDNLSHCQQETNRLGNFVKLIDQVILANLTRIIRDNVSTFVYYVMQNVSEESREAMFKCSLHFNHEGELDITPSRTEFSRVVSRALYYLPTLVCDVSFAIDADYLIDQRIDQRPETRYTAIGAQSREFARGVGSTNRGIGSRLDMNKTSESRKPKSTSAAHVTLISPELKNIAFPEKTDDDLGVRTPELAVSNQVYVSMEVTGSGYFGNYAPLSSDNVAQLLVNDRAFQSTLAECDQLLKSAFDEVDQFVAENAWLNEIEAFCREWDVKTKVAWKGAQAFHIEDYNPREQAQAIEQQLSMLRGWMERIKNTDKSFLSTNQLILVDCTKLQDRMVPRLNDMYQDIVEFVAGEAFELANGFIQEMKNIINIMNSKASEIDAFAKYAKAVGQYKKSTAAYQQKVEYIKTLFEVVRMSYRQLAPSEEKLESQLMYHWEMFLGQIQDASEFINTQTPVMMNGLESMYEALLDEAEKLGLEATAGAFLDPTKNPTKMLIRMRLIREAFYTLRKKLEQASKWKEEITGEGYELKFLQEIGNAMDVRQELWKYVEVAEHAIKDWKSTMFKKMNIQKALDKLTEWLVVASNMQAYLPPGDQVLAHWFKLLEDFKQELPILHRMGSDALKGKHWKAIFVGMGENYEDSWEFTVEELLNYKLANHHGLISAIYARAKAEFQLEQRLNRLERLWNTNDVYFKLAKYIPDTVYNADKSRLDAAPRRNVGVKSRTNSRLTPNAAQPRGMDTSGDDLYILVETDELRHLLEDGQVSLQQMLLSPFISQYRHACETLYNKLREVDELLELWISTQDKWLYLMKLFEEPQIYARMSSQSYLFEGVHHQMKDIQKTVLADAAVMSITTHARGEKGYKTLQGENLRRMFSNMIKTQEEILKNFTRRLSKIRQDFPRLYFQPDADLVSMMAVIRNPSHFLGLARKCFPGLDSIRFKLPEDFVNSANIALDYQLNGDKLEAVCVYGRHDEAVALLERVQPLHYGPAWLSQLERLLKRSLVLQLHNALLDILHKDRLDVSSLIEEVEEMERKSKDISQKTHKHNNLPFHLNKEQTQYKHRLLRFPIQTVITAVSILWSRSMMDAFSKTPHTQTNIVTIRDSLRRKIDELGEIIKYNSPLMFSQSGLRVRLSLITRRLLLCYKQLHDKTQEMLDQQVSCINCFDWSQTLHYEMEVKPMLRAKTFVTTATRGENVAIRERSYRVPDATLRPRSPSHLGTNSPHLGSERSGISRQRSSYIHSHAEDVENTETSVELVQTYTLGELDVVCLDSRYKYDHEYSGPGQRMITTPLTERAQYCLISAMNDYKVGTLMGDSGTGKSETVANLAQLLGTCVFPVTCSPEFSLPSLDQIVAGVVQSGCWAVLDDAQRLALPDMSVIGQALHTVTSALRTLRYNRAYEYSLRGFPATDQSYVSVKTKRTEPKPSKMARRNSLTTLHSLQQDEQEVTVNGAQPILPRVYTFVPDREGTMLTCREEGRRARRHSISRETDIHESELYKDIRPPSLFYDKLVVRNVSDKMSDLRHLQSSDSAYAPRFLGNLMYNGLLMPARDNAALFMCVNTQNPAWHNIPQTLKEELRPCSMLSPDLRPILETVFFSWQFPDASPLVDRLLRFRDILTTALPGLASCGALDLTGLRSIAELSSERFYNPALSPEFTESPVPDDGLPVLKPERSEEALVFGLACVILPVLRSEAECAVFRDALRDIFPLASDFKSPRIDPELVNTIKDQLKTAGLQNSENQVEIITRLYSSLQRGSSVLLTGLSGTGKTTAYTILCQAINTLHNRKNETAAANDELQPSHALSGLTKQVPKDSEFLRSMDGRERSHLMKKWSTLSKTFASLGSLHSVAQEINRTGSASMNYPRVNLTTLCPASMSINELFGEYVNGVWRSGTLTYVLEKMVKRIHAADAVTQTYSEKKKKLITDASIIENWLVLDGDMNAVWFDNLASFTDSNAKLTLANGKSVPLTRSTNMILECADLSTASPSALARCSLVHCPSTIVPWRSLIASWMTTARHRWMFTTSSLKLLGSMISDVIDSTLRFAETELVPALDSSMLSGAGSYKKSARGIHEVQTFLRIMTSLMDRYMLRESPTSPADPVINTNDHSAGGATSLSSTDPQSTSRNAELTPRSADAMPRNTEPMPSDPSEPSEPTMNQDAPYDETRHHQEVIKCIFVYSYVWAFGGHLDDRSRWKFDQYARETIMRIPHSMPLPRSGSVYDLFVDAKEGVLSRWQDKPAERMRSIPANYTVTPEIERIYHLVDMMISSHHNVLLTGAPGVGKSTFINSLFLSRQQFTKIVMSPGLTSAMFQQTVIIRLQELRRNSVSLIGSSFTNQNKAAQRHFFYIDDLSAAAKSSHSGVQPNLESLREMVSHQLTYDRKRHVFENASPATILAASTTPGHPGSGYGTYTHSLPDRLIRHFTVVSFFTPTDDALHSLYGRTLQTWLEEFPSYAVEHHHEFAKAMMQAILDMYKLTCEKFRATPTQGHYVFTLHDVSHVVEGILLLSPRKTKSKPKRARKKENAVTNASNLFGGMLPGGKLNKDKFRSFSIKDSKDTKATPNAALPMMPVIARLFCHEVTRTFADRLLSAEDENWFKKSLQDQVEKHFCTAHADWIDTHQASRHVRATTKTNGESDEQKITKTKKGTPLPFGTLGTRDESTDDSGSDLSDGSMTEVTAEVVSPLSDDDTNTQTYGRHQTSRNADRAAEFDDPAPEDDVAIDKSHEDEGAITPFTETTVNLPELPITPEHDDEKPTFDHFHGPSHPSYNAMHETRLGSSSSDDDSSEGSETDRVSPTTDTETSTHPAAASTRAISQRTDEKGASIKQQLPPPSYPRPSAAPQGAAQPVGGVIKKRKSLLKHSDSKRGVTFKTGLIADKEIESDYKGALMTFDEVRSVSDDIMDITFTKYFVSTYADYVGVSAEKGYAQYNTSQLSEALDACTHIYNQASGTPTSPDAPTRLTADRPTTNLRLVFFSAAVRHACRLSRVLTFPGAHSILMGLPHSAGRSTLVRLASFITHAKLFEVKEKASPAETLEHFSAQVKDCSQTAGVLGRPTILYVHSGMPDLVYQQLSCVMTEGQYPGLYTPQDVQTMATAMTPGQVQTKKIDKIEASFERYLKKIRQQMHVIICLDYSASRSEETFELLRHFPKLLTRATHIDCYKPWTFETYQYVAKHWLVNLRGADKLYWDKDLYTEQVTAVSKAMAYMHKSAERSLDLIRSHRQRVSTYFTPRTFLEFQNLFRATAARIIEKNTSKLEMLKKVLERVDEAFTSIRNLETHCSMLEPKLALAVARVNDLRSNVDVFREKYITALDGCRVAEDKLEALKVPLQNMKKQADSAFDKVNPTYYAAMTALKHLNKRDLEELKSYRAPPEGVHIVGEALCHMFEQEHADWETAKMLMFKPSFFQDLEFFDKTHISEKVFSKLEQYCSERAFDPEVIRSVSLAARALCLWVHAVYSYACIYRNIAPKLADLLNAEEAVTRAQRELGQRRIQATKVKAELETLIAEHKEASAAMKVLEKQFKSMKRRIGDAKEVMVSMELQHKIWRSELSEAEARLECVLGDSVLIAAICTYQGALDSHTREALTNSWRERCFFNEFDIEKSYESRLAQLSAAGQLVEPPSIFDKLRDGLKSLDAIHQVRKPHKASRRPLAIREDFSLQNILSDFNEVSTWVRAGLGEDVHVLQSLIMMRTLAVDAQTYWPLLIDPDQQAERLLTLLHHGVKVLPVENSSGSQALTAFSQGSFDPKSASTDIESVISRLDTTTVCSSELSTNADHKLAVSPAPSHLAPLQTKRPRSHNTEVDSDLYKPNTSIHRPEHNVWSVNAAEPLLIKYLINAIVHGVVLLLRSVDRLTLPPEFTPILSKTFGYDESNRIIKIKDFSYVVHPEFKLYLASDTSVYLRGDDSRPLPFRHSAIIDLSLSQQSRVDALLTNILKLEKPDYEAQCRSLDGGILHHKMELDSEHYVLQNRVANMNQAILDDHGMLNDLRRSYESIISNSQILDETLYLKQQLHERRESYLPVALHAAMMYDVWEHMSIISPYYFISFSAFHALCVSTVESRHRGKGVIGAPAARCHELVEAVAAALLRLVRSVVFERDFTVYALLVAVQRMASQTTPGEEIQAFVNSSGLGKRANHKLQHDKPCWINHECWIACLHLEGQLACFSGLTESLLKRSDEWKEYFYSGMSIVSQVPCDSLKLSVFQKCILWRTVLPNRLSEVCEKLLLTELGPSALQSRPYTVSELHSASKQSQPIVILEPRQMDISSQSDSGSTGFDSLVEIRALAPRSESSRRPVIIAFGRGVQAAHAESQFRACLQNGTWLVLHNCHLLESWSPSLIALIQRVLSIREEEFESIEARARKEPIETYQQMNPGIHPQFRLWLICQHSEEICLPSAVIWSSSKLVNQQKNDFRLQVMTTYKHAIRTHDTVQRHFTDKDGDLATAYLLPLTILHAVLTQRAYYGAAAFVRTPWWSPETIAQVVSKMPILMDSCRHQQSLIDFARRIYESSTLTLSDRALVESLIRSILSVHDSSHQEVECDPLLDVLLDRTDPHSADLTTDQLSRRLDNMATVNAATVGLPLSANLHLRRLQSRNISSNLVRLSGSPQRVFESRVSFDRVDDLLSGWQSVLLTLPELPLTNPDPLTLEPLENALHQEVVSYRRLIRRLNQDSEILRAVTKGEVSASGELLDMIEQLHHGKVPDAWLRLMPGSSPALMTWKAELERALALLVAYLEPATRSPVWNLSVFTEPRRFLQSILIKHARTHYQDLNDLQLLPQFLPMGFAPTAPPTSGLYLSGLRLHNAIWDTSSASLAPCRSDETVNPIPILHVNVGAHRPAARDAAALDCPLVITSDNSMTVSDKLILTVPLRLPSVAAAQRLRQQMAYITSRLPL